MINLLEEQQTKNYERGEKMKFWPKDSLSWYEKACDMFDYPNKPFGSFIKEIISSKDTVLDLGCGLGAASLMIAPWCKKVLAFDQDQEALDRLESKMSSLDISNIERINGCWPMEDKIHPEVVIALNVHNALKTVENMSAMYQMAKRAGFIACAAPTSREEESFLELKKELGIEPHWERCNNGCWTKGVLEGLGAFVQCQKVTYEFGQPLNTMEEVVQFIGWQIGVDSSSENIIRKYSEKYIIKQNNKLIVPITRQSCGITFEKAIIK